MTDMEELTREVNSLKSLVASWSKNDRQDPSALTVARIDHEISGLRELLVAKDGVNEARLAAMDKAVTLLEKFPSAIDIAVGNLKELHEEKFSGIEKQFDALTLRLKDGDVYRQTALDAALKAAQILVDSQQKNFTESIKKTEELFTKQLESVVKIVDDLKGSTRLGAGQTIAWVFAGISSVGTVIAILVAINAIMHH